MGLLDKKTKMICLTIGQSQPEIFYLQKLWISKKYTLFIKGKIPLLLNLTQFYTPGDNTNLKNEFIWKTPFSKNKDPRPTIGHKYQTGQKKEQQMRNQND